MWSIAAASLQVIQLRKQTSSTSHVLRRPAGCIHVRMLSFSASSLCFPLIVCQRARARMPSETSGEIGVILFVRFHTSIRASMDREHACYSMIHLYALSLHLQL